MKELSYYHNWILGDFSPYFGMWLNCALKYVEFTSFSVCINSPLHDVTLLTYTFRRLGGAVVSVLVSGPKDRGSYSAESMDF
jgi:hypothetical protein